MYDGAFFMRVTCFLAVIALIVFFTGCSASQPRKITSIEQIAGTVPKKQMRKRWINAERKVPPVEKIPLPEKSVTQRKFTIIATKKPIAKRPVISPDSPVAVKLFSTRPIAKYTGPFKVFKSAPGNVVGNLENLRIPLEILFKLPEDSQRLRVEEGMTLSLELRDEVKNAALQRHIVLTKNNQLRFLYLSEGSGKPFIWTSDSPRIVIQQRSGEKGTSPVEITIGRDKQILKVGQKVKIGEYAAMLISSFFTDPKKKIVVQGDPYHITLIIY